MSLPLYINRERILGRAVYKNKLCHQVINFETSLIPALQSLDFTDIIEIGTANGGLTFFLHDTFPDKVIHTFDVLPDKQRKTEFLYSLDNVEPTVANIFDANFNITSRYVADIIDKTNNLLVMCDGGNKVEEVKSFAKRLKVGDYIMWHDYAEPDVLKKLKEIDIWRAFEVRREDVEPTLVENGFELIHPQLQYIAWGCARKVK